MNDAELVDHLDRHDGHVNLSTDFMHMVALAHTMRLEPHVVRGWAAGSETWLYQHLGRSHDVVVLGNPSMLPGSTSFDPAGGHYVLLSDVDRHGNFVVHDPWLARPFTLTPVELGRFVSSYRQSSLGGAMMALHAAP